MLATKHQQLRYDLTPEELLELARKQARLFEEKNSVEEQLTQIKADFKGRITLLDNEIQQSTRRIQSGYEMRSIEILVLRHRPSIDEAIEIRLDIGECMAVRRLLPEEKQLRLVEEGEPAARYEWVAAIWWENAPMQIPVTQMEADKLQGLVDMRPFEDHPPIALIGDGKDDEPKKRGRK